MDRGAGTIGIQEAEQHIYLSISDGHISFIEHFLDLLPSEDTFKLERALKFFHIDL